MNDKLLIGLNLFAAIAGGVMTGLFFTFSVFMMTALDRLPSEQSVAAMQSINKAIVTPLFILVFLGTAIASIALIGISLFTLDEPGRVYMLVGSGLYLIGVMVITIGYHIPRNDAIDAIDPNSAEAASHWARYMAEWVPWNHVRGLASLGATASFILAIRAI